MYHYWTSIVFCYYYLLLPYYFVICSYCWSRVCHGCNNYNNYYYYFCCIWLLLLLCGTALTTSTTTTCYYYRHNRYYYNNCYYYCAAVTITPSLYISPSVVVAVAAETAKVVIVAAVPVRSELVDIEGLKRISRGTLNSYKNNSIVFDRGSWLDFNLKLTLLPISGSEGHLNILHAKREIDTTKIIFLLTNCFVRGMHLRNAHLNKWSIHGTAKACAIVITVESTIIMIFRGWGVWNKIL